MSLSRLLAAASLIASVTEEEPQTFASAEDVARAAREYFTPAPTPADDTRALRAALEGQSWDDGRVALLKSAMPHLRITSAQAAELLETFTFDSGRLKAAPHLASSVIDRGGWFQVAESFTFSSDGRKAVALLL